MKQTMLRTLTVACAVAFAGSAWAADNVTKCGSAQLKALSGLITSSAKESARACAQAPSDAPADVETEVSGDKVTSFTDKFNAAITKAETTFLDANCFVETSGGEAIVDLVDGEGLDSVTAARMLAFTQQTASDLCDSTGNADD